MPKITGLRLLIISMVLMAWTTSAFGTDWTILTPDPSRIFSNAEDHAIAVGSDGTLYVAYGQKNLYLAKKLVSSVNWSIEIVDSSSQVGNYASLALDANDNPHISYQDRGNMN